MVILYPLYLYSPGHPDNLDEPVRNITVPKDRDETEEDPNQEEEPLGR